MGKINKYANLYDTDGNLIRHIDENTGKLEDYTIEELEELVDKLSSDKDENGKVRKPQELNNVNFILMQMYQKHGNQHIFETIQKLSEAIKNKETEPENEQKEDPNEIVHSVVSNFDEEYAEFEEVNENEN